MIFVGSKVFTHARYWQIKKYVCMIFFFGGGTWGGTRSCKRADNNRLHLNFIFIEFIFSKKYIARSPIKNVVVKC